MAVLTKLTQEKYERLLGNNLKIEWKFMTS